MPVLHGALAGHHFRHPWRSRVVARCVRRAWLSSFDEYAGRDYSHRKEWILDRMSLLTQQLTPREVVARWTQLVGTPPIISRFMSDQMEEGEREVAERVIEEWRRRL